MRIRSGCFVLTVCLSVTLPASGLPASTEEKPEPTYRGKPLSHWIAALRDKNLTIRLPTFNALRGIGEPAIPSLLELLKDKDAWARGGAAFALGWIGPTAKDAAPALGKALDDEDEVVRMLAARSLGMLGPGAKEAIPALVRVMQSGKQFDNQFAATSLGNIGPAAKEAIPALVEALKYDDQTLAARAAEALWKIDPRNDAILPALIRIVKEGKDSMSRATAASALGPMGPAAKAASPVLTIALKDPADNVRLVAAASLWEIDNKSTTAIASLVESLQGKDEFLAGGAAEYLGRCGPGAKDAVLALREALKSNNSVSAHAAEALWKMDRRDKTLVPVLVKVLKGNKLIDRLAAAAVLSGMGSDARDAVAALIEALKDEEESVRESAADALWKVDPEAARNAGAKHVDD